MSVFLFLYFADHTTYFWSAGSTATNQHREPMTPLVSSLMTSPNQIRQNGKIFYVPTEGVIHHAPGWGVIMRRKAFTRFYHWPPQQEREAESREGSHKHERQSNSRSNKELARNDIATQNFPSSACGLKDYRLCVLHLRVNALPRLFYPICNTKGKSELISASNTASFSVVEHDPEVCSGTGVIAFMVLLIACAAPPPTERNFTFFTTSSRSYPTAPRSWLPEDASGVCESPM